MYIVFLSGESNIQDNFLSSLPNPQSGLNTLALLIQTSYTLSTIFHSHHLFGFMIVSREVSTRRRSQRRCHAPTKYFRSLPYTAFSIRSSTTPFSTSSTSYDVHATESEFDVLASFFKFSFVCMFKRKCIESKK